MQKITNKGDEVLHSIEEIYIKQTNVYDFKKFSVSCGSFLCVFCLFAYNTIHTCIQVSKIQIRKVFK